MIIALINKHGMNSKIYFTGNNGEPSQFPRGACNFLKLNYCERIFLLTDKMKLGLIFVYFRCFNEKVSSSYCSLVI